MKRGEEQVEEQTQANILGLALAHGVVNLHNVREAAQADQPNLLNALVDLGVMDQEDLKALERSLERRSTGSGAETDGSTQDSIRDPTEPAPDLVRGVLSGSGVRPQAANKLLTAMALDTWKHYRNLRFIGEGGMGRIFRAYDPTLKRVVALKFLSRDAPDMIQRFVMEAQHQGSVDHPNICKVYEVGDWQGQPYIAMQYLQGETLEIAAPNMTLTEKAEVMVTVAEAIHAAHRQGLIHRDVKPANIMIRRAEDRSPKAYVLDFGLAHTLVASGLTVPGMVLGTLHYMAPEQVLGQTDKIGRQTDVYGLGATLYRILTGKAPFAQADGFESIKLACEEEVQSLRRLAPEVPVDLETIVMKCLERDPARRYPTAREVAEDLRRFLEDEPIMARTPTLGYRLTMWRRKHKALVALAAGSLAVILALTSWSVSTWLTASARARWAQHFGQKAERMEAQIRYSHLLPIHDLSGERRAAEAAMAGIEREIRIAGRVAAGPGHYAQGRGYLALGEPELAKPCLERAWSEGFRAPELSYAYGQVTGLLYQRELELAQRLEQPELREARIAEIRKHLRGPALWHLHAGASVDSPLFPEALIAFYDGRLDEALTKAQQAFQARPWFYEARKLEGDILFARAQTLQDPAKVLAALQKAATTFSAAQGIAPSDASLYLREAQVHVDVLDHLQRDGGELRPELEACQNAASKAAIVAPGDPGAWVSLSEATCVWARQLEDTGKNPLEKLEEASRLAEQAMTLGPRDKEALFANAEVCFDWGFHFFEAHQDPREKLRLAIHFAQLALALDPWDLRANFIASHAFKKQMTYEMIVGLPPWESFEGALTIETRALQQHPELTMLRDVLGSTWVERAEYERKNGLDPLPSATQAISQFQQSLASATEDFHAQVGLGDAHLIEAQQAQALGLDVRGPAELALKAYERARTLNHKVSYPTDAIGETHLLLAQACLDGGRSPILDLQAAEAALAASQRTHPKYYWTQVLQGRLGLLLAQWTATQGGNSRPPLDQAMHTFQSVLAEMPTESGARLGLAEAQLLLAHFHFQPWEAAVARGQASLAKTFAANARNADAYLAAGKLWAFKAKQTHRPGDVDQARAYLGQALQLNRNLQRQISAELQQL
jgi:serine/threonine-protein kinase